MTRRWEPGELGCGQLTIALRRAVLALAPGERLEAVLPGDGPQSDVRDRKSKRVAAATWRP